jgi:hypothetical protein
MAAETASAATIDTTILFTNLPFNRSAGGFWPIPFAALRANSKVPGSDPVRRAF